VPPRRPKSARAVKAQEPSRRGPALAAGWYLYLAAIALVPVVMGALPPSFGAIAAVRAYDPFSLFKLCVLCALIGLSAAAWGIALVRGETELYWRPALWVILSATGWGVVSAIFSSSIPLAIWGAQGRNDGLVAFFAYFLVAGLGVQYIRSFARMRAVMVAVVFSSLPVSLYAALQNSGIDPWQWQNSVGRVAGSLGNPDLLGTFLVLPVICALGLALTASGRVSAIAWGATSLVPLYALYISQTRGAWIGLVAALAAGAIALWPRTFTGTPKRRIAFVAVIVLAVALGVATVFIRAERAAGAHGLAAELTQLSNGRTVIWAIALQAWLSHPIVGWGPDAFARAFSSAVNASWYALVAGTYTSVDNAHNFFIERLVTLGLPGLLLTLWALGAGVVRGLKEAPSDPRDRRLVLAVWSALVGLLVALFFGVTAPEVVVWPWLCAGLLLAAGASRVENVRASTGWIAALVGVALTVLVGSWLLADFTAGEAMQMPTGPDKVASLANASAINPLAEIYRGLIGDSLLNEAVAEQQQGQPPATADATLERGIVAYQDAAAFDRGDPVIRAALANLLIGFAKNHPESNAATQAVAVAEEARALAPHDAAVLTTLARAYQVDGRDADARAAARLARQVAPDYANQTLGPLGLLGNSSR
jgi:putative inorganic carbon (HCO3(-)) transporter